MRRPFWLALVLSATSSSVGCAATQQTRRPQAIAVLTCPREHGDPSASEDLSAPLIAQLRRSSSLRVLASPALLPPELCQMRLGMQPVPVVDVPARYGIVVTAHRLDGGVQYQMPLIDLAGFRILSSPSVRSTADRDHVLRLLAEHALAVIAGEGPAQ